ncbi:MAG: polymer-forming cytoskeletal protein, partial [Opitutae bacterium]
MKPSEGAFADGDKTKLDGIETNATADQTAADIRTLGFFDTSNDGAGSGLDADLLDGNHASAFATSSQGTLADSALQDVVDDTTPQLGGSLDVNGQEITGAIDLHSTGDVVIELGDAAGTNKVSVRDSAAVEVASINSDGDISAQDIVVAGTVDGRDVAADGSKLDGIAAGAEVNTVDSVNSQTGTVVLDADDISDASTTNKFVTAADITNLGNLSGTNTGDQDLSSYQLKPSEGAFADGDKTKLDYLTVTQAVDLDDIETRVNALDAAVVLQGSWDASGGSFPGSGSAQAGDSYIVSVAGTVDSVAFSVNDRLLAIVDNASTSTYASNWLKLDYTDQVLSVNSQTGAVDLDADDISDASTTNKFVTAADITNLGNLSGTNTGDQDLSSYQLQPSEGAFANGDKTKLDGIEAGADVTDAANVETAIEAISLTSTSGDTGDEVLIIDATDGQLKAVLWEALPSVAVASAAPSTPSNGHLWFDTDTGQTFIYYDDGTSTQWVEVGAVGEFAMTTASAAPSNPSNGDMWFDTTNGKTFVYYVETGGSSQWVEVGAASAGASGVDGSVQFSSGGTFTSDNANFYWDDTNNRLGIGTNSPQEALELEGTSPLLRITSNNTAPVYGTLLGGLQWYGNDATSASGVGAYIAAFGGGESGEQQLRFGTGTQAAVAGRMTIDSSGNVGIGTNSPNRLLTLNATDSYIGWSEGGSEGWAAGYEGSNDRWVLYGGT